MPLIIRRRWFGDWPKHNLKHKDRLASCIQLVKAAPVGTPRAEACGALKLQSNSMRITSCENHILWESFLTKILKKMYSKIKQRLLCIYLTPNITGNSALDERSPVRHLLCPQPPHLFINWYKQDLQASLLLLLTMCLTETGTTHYR